MAEVRLTAGALADLQWLEVTHSLPVDTRERVKRRLRALADLPRLGRPLDHPWDGFRFILGPWRWMLIVYAFDEGEDAVIVVSIHDARSSSAATAIGR